MTYHWPGSIVDQQLTEDMANYQVSHGSVSIAYYVNVETRRSIVHSHPYYEYILVRKGKADYQANGQSFSLYPDEMVLLAPGVSHVMSCEADQGSYERMILQINASFMDEILKACHLDGRKPTLPPPICILPAEAVHSWKITELIERIHATMSIQDVELREMLYRVQIMEFILTAEVILQTSTPKAPTVSSTLVSNVIAYMQEHFQDPKLRVADLAKRFYVSREHLSRTFKEYTGDSLREYLLDLRMQEFRNGLINGDTVVSACQNSGFSDYSSFVKSFRKLYGITPVEYREQLRKAMAQLPIEHK